MSPANPNEKSWDEVTLNEVWDSGKALAYKAWARTSRRMRVAAGILIFLCVLLARCRAKLRSSDSISVPRR